MKCIKCKKDRLRVVPVFINHKYTKICPICALIRINKMHDLPLNTSFVGIIAKRYYDEEIEYEKKTM